MKGGLFEAKKRTKPYRFGFNGQEKDNEAKGVGNSYDFGARIQDPRLGRWLSLDPLMAKYSDQSPYTFCANNPVFLVDRDGKEIIIHYKVEVEGEMVNKSFVYKPGMKVPEDANVFAQRAVESLDHLYNKGTSLSKEVIGLYLGNEHKAEIKQSNDGRNATSPETGIIDWNDQQGMITMTPNPLTGENRRPPAATLFHEFLHKWADAYAGEVISAAEAQFSAGLITQEQYNEQYQFAKWLIEEVAHEETGLIPEFETPFQMEMGWGIRVDLPLQGLSAHAAAKGTYTADCATCTTGPENKPAAPTNTTPPANQNNNTEDEE